MHILNNHLSAKKWILSSLLSALLILLNSTAQAKYCQKECVTPVKYCQNRYSDCQERADYGNHGNCPCFSSAGQLDAALGNYPPPTSCRASKAYSVLSGGTLTFTTQEYGNAFSCYFENINRNTNKEVVKYGTQQEVLNMHLACDAIIREFARAKGIKCNK